MKILGNIHVTSLVLIALFSASSFGVVHAQEPDVPPESDAAALTDEIVTARRKAAAENADLTDDVKAKIEQLYQQAQAELDRGVKLADKASTHDKRIADAPAKLDSLKAEAAAPVPASLFKAPPDADLDTLDALLAEARAALETAQEQFNTAEAEPRRRAVRQAELPTQLAEAVAKLEQAQADLTEPLDPATADPTALARQTLREAELFALEREVNELRKEADMLTATAGQPALQLDIAAAPLATLKKDVDKLAELVQGKLATLLEDKLNIARRKAELAPAPVKGVLKENVRLIEQGQALSKRRNELEAQLATDTALRDQWRKTIDGVKANIEAVGLWETIAWEMRSQRRLLPDPREYRGKPRARREEVRDRQYERLKLYDQDADLASIDDEVDALLSSFNWPVGEDEAMEIRFAAREAYEEQARIVDRLQVGYERYFALVTKLDAVQREIAVESDNYAQFIDERVLWIRSTTPLFSESPKRINESLTRWTNAAAWQTLLRVLWLELRTHPIAYGLGFLGFLLWSYFHQRLRARISEIGRVVRTNPTVPLRRSLEAFVLTLIVSLLWPGLMFVLAWRIGAASGATPLVRAVADGLFFAAVTQLFLEVPRRFCRDGGIADAHFGWPSRAVAQMRRVLLISMMAFVPAAWVIGVTESLSGRTRDDVIGRVVLVLTMLFAAVIVWMLLRPRSAIVQALAARAPLGWLAWGRRLLFLPGMLIALALGGLAAAGLYHTALELTWCAASSLVLLFAIVVAYGLGIRWFVAARVRLARARLLREYEVETPTSAPANGNDNTAALDATQEIDSATIKMQTQRILLTLLYLVAALGLWWIWIEVFPALAALRRVTLFDTSVANITLAVLTAIFAYVAARNLPGLLEVMVLQNLPLDGGARYAITTICRYTISVAAVVIIAWLVGFDWSNIQWLVAAMLVGLGFGLQEIFANFVSGLIILLERPIRPGDWVTIGGTDGRVTRINMRATTILNWDSKELIVPNKDIVTGQVMNWSLSETTLRVVIKVGIAYGSDTQLATEILKRVCAEQANVLDTPKPKVIFREFGDSALIFELRIFIPHLDYWPNVMHGMHMNIDREFRAAGIEIAFPQRDLHIRSSEAEFVTRAKTDEA